MATTDTAELFGTLTTVKGEIMASREVTVKGDTTTGNFIHKQDSKSALQKLHERKEKFFNGGIFHSFFGFSFVKIL